MRVSDLNACLPITLQASNGVVLKLFGVLDDLGVRHILASRQSVLPLRKLLDDEGRSHVILLDVSRLELQNGMRACMFTVPHARARQWLPSNCHLTQLMWSMQASRHRRERHCLLPAHLRLHGQEQGDPRAERGDNLARSPLGDALRLQQLRHHLQLAAF